MINNKTIIHRMTLKEKLSFVISGTLFESSSLGSYKFPTIKFSQSFKEDTFRTVFPSSYQLAYTWNSKLIENVAAAKASEIDFSNNFTSLKLESYALNDKVESYLNSKVNMATLKGFKASSNIKTALEYVEFNDNVKKNKEIDEQAFDMVLSGLKNDIDYTIINKPEEYDFLRTKMRYNQVILAKSNDINDIVHFIYRKVPLIFTRLDFEALYIELEKKFELEQRAIVDFNEGKIDKIKLNEKYESGEIASLDSLNYCVDNLIGLIRQEDINKEAREQNKSENTLANQIDLMQNRDLAYYASLESIVLLKNNQHLLPLKPDGLKVGFIGEAISNSKLFLDEMETKPTCFENLYHLMGINDASVNKENPYLVMERKGNVNSYNIVGFAQGYDTLNETSFNQVKTKELINASEEIVLFIYLKDGEETIPEYQSSIVDLIKDSDDDKKVIVILKSSKQVDLSPIERADAILYVNNIGQEINVALLDILLGNASPSGKLPFEYISDGRVTYHVGHGLSYSDFELSDLKITDNGVSVIVKNIGEVDANTIVQLYVTKTDTDSSLSEKLLKGFEKVYLKQGESMRVNLEFDAFTFRYYNEKKKSYGVEKGTYLISVGTSYETSLNSEIKLSESLESEFLFETNNEKTLDDNSTIDELIEKGPKKHLFALHLTLTLVVMAYFIAIGAYLIYYNIAKNKSGLALFVISGVLMGLAIIFGLLRILTLKKTDQEIYNNPNENLSKYVNGMKSLDVLSRIDYAVNEDQETSNEVVIDKVEEIVKEEPSLNHEEGGVQGNELVEEEVEAVTEIDVDNVSLSKNEIEAFEEEERRKLLEAMNQDVIEDLTSEEENIVYDNTSSLNKLITNFIDFAKSKGLVVEVGSSRAIFSALAASKMIFLTSAMKEILPDFMMVLNQFLGNKNQIIEASDTWISGLNLAWVKQGEVYEKTEFISDLYKSNALKNNLNTLLLKNVSLDNIHAYLDDFISFASNPNKEHLFQVNNKTSIRIPKNFVTLIMLSSDAQLNKMDLSLASASMVVDVVIRKAEPIILEEEINALSYPYFMELVAEEKNTSYLSEAKWKTIDEFVMDLSKNEPFKIDNKSVSAIENYASVFLSSGGDENVLVTNILASKIIPLVKNTNLYKESKDLIYLSNYITNCFGADTLASIKHTLTYGTEE